MCNKLLFSCILSSIVVSTLSSQQCSDWITDLINNKFTTAPKETILYSGIAINNVGQREQCQSQNFTYVLIYIPGQPPNMSMYTGVCIPSECDADDVEEYVSFFNEAITFDYTEKSIDALGWIGLVCFYIYAVVIVLATLVNSFKRQDSHKNSQEDSQTESKLEINVSLGTNQSKEGLIEIPKKNEKGIFLRIFDCYEHYCKIFHIPAKRNILIGLRVMAVFMIVVATQFSLRQNIAQNNIEATTMLNGGVGYIIQNVGFSYAIWLFSAGVTASYALHKVQSFGDIFKGIMAKFTRLWPYLLFFTVFAYGLTQALIDSPLLKVWQMKYTKDCPHIFWRKWFLINPIFLDNTVCMPWTWLIETQLLFYLFTPFYILIFKSCKAFGYLLMSSTVVVSIIFSSFLLKFKNYDFYPSLLFNNSHGLVYQYQMNPLSNYSSFQLGLIFGIFFINALEKNEGEGRTNEKKFAKLVKRSEIVQYTLHLLGLVLMNATFWMIVWTVDKPKESITRFFLSFAQPIFLFGLGLFIIPSFLSGNSRLTKIINGVLGGSFWIPLDKIAIAMYLTTPVVIGITTFSIQSNINYDYFSVGFLLMADLTLLVLVSMFMTSTIEIPLAEVHKELDYYVFGTSSKESLVVIED